ncbi:hypothetical protein LTR60_002780, partial [Cryomyces antarcticus]
MKAAVVTVLVASAAGVLAQYSYPSSSGMISSTSSMSAPPMPLMTPSPSGMMNSSMTTMSPSSYTTEYYDDCDTTTPETIVTVTNGVTVTHCPLCDMSTAPHTTVYTTVYTALCSTGLVPSTYTVTESCTEATPTWSAGSSYVPQGFTVTEMMCTVCGAQPTPVTLTVPCTSTPAGMPSNATASPAMSVPATSTPAMSSAAKSAASMTPPYPMPAATTATAMCPGPQCKMAGTGASMPTAVTYGNISGITPYVPGSGASSTVSLGWSFAGFAVSCIAGFAFL